MADPINWGLLSQNPIAASLAQGQVLAPFQDASAMPITPVQQAGLNAHYAQTDATQQGNMLSYLSEQQKAQLEAEKQAEVVRKNSADILNNQQTQAREAALAHNTMRKTDAEIRGSDADLESKRRDNFKQQLLLNASQQGGLQGYLQALEYTDPDKFLTAQKAQTDLQTAILGNAKSVYDLQGSQRDQAVKNFEAAHTILMTTEQSRDKDAYWDTIAAPVLDKLGIEHPENYDHNWVAGAFAAGANASKPATALSARAVPIAATSELGLKGGQKLRNSLAKNGGTPTKLQAASVTAAGMKVPDALLADDVQAYRDAYVQRASAIRQILKGEAGDNADMGSINAQVDSVSPNYGDSAEDARNKLIAGDRILQSASQQINPEGVGLGNADISDEAPKLRYSADQLSSAAALAVQQGHYKTHEEALADLTKRAGS